MSNMFKAAVGSTTVLSGAFCAGLGAVRPADRARINAARPRALRGSVDLDATLKKLLPTDSRWDYGVGLAESKAERVFWIEVHPATERGAAEVEAKLEWLKAWLREHAPALNALERTFVWIASGAVGISPKSSIRRRLATMGLSFSGGHLRLP